MGIVMGRGRKIKNLKPFRDLEEAEGVLHSTCDRAPVSAFPQSRTNGYKVCSRPKEGWPTHRQMEVWITGEVNFSQN